MARLMSAAPEMLKALNKAKFVLGIVIEDYKGVTGHKPHKCDELTKAMELIESAIKSAKGE